jgi:hypothetical protein
VGADRVDDAQLMPVVSVMPVAMPVSSVMPLASAKRWSPVR